MSTPTRQEIIAAHEALEALCKRLPGTRYAEMTILTALPPKPQPTMAEVEWDDELQYLAEAIHPVYDTVLMMGQYMDGTVKCIMLDRTDSKAFIGYPDDLTLTGKHYRLQEVQDD